MLRPAHLDSSLIGHLLPWDLFSESGVLVASAGLLIASDADYQRLRARPLYLQSQAAAIGENLLERYERQVTRAEELLYAPETLTAPALLALVDALLELSAIDADACLGYTRLVAVTRPALRHCLLVMFIVHRLARDLEYTEQESRCLAGAALTMNLADLERLDHLHADDSPAITLAQASLYEHPTRAADGLRRIGIDDPVWLDSVRQHHENMDASGYPGALAGAEIGLPARLLRVAECYCLRIGGRNYLPPRNPRYNFQAWFGTEQSRIDVQIATLVLRLLGAQPPGTLLRLVNRETACITRSSRSGHARLAVSFLDARGALLDPPRERNLDHHLFRPRAFVLREPVWANVAWKRLWGY